MSAAAIVARGARLVMPLEEQAADSLGPLLWGMLLMSPPVEPAEPPRGGDEA
jgi:hypothetical protein